METTLQRREPQKAEKPNQTGIPAQMKRSFEQRSGMSFDDVRVHYHSERPGQLGALAYTQGTQVYIGPGQEASLPHELGHVIQQKAGRVRPTGRIGGLPVNDQPELEREADRQPVQCMPAPALWGVVQMDLPMIPQQSGSNCGFHALARVIQRVAGIRRDFADELTAFAIGEGYSVVGEAFDPYALMEGGNRFCDKYKIDARSEVIFYNDEDILGRLMDLAKRTKCFLVMPYFPVISGPAAGKTPPQPWMPTDSGGRRNAHWAAIDTQPGESSGKVGAEFMLYEGNYYGSYDPLNPRPPAAYDPRDPKYRPLIPMPVTAKELFDSNDSIVQQFDWEQDYYNLGDPTKTPDEKFQTEQRRFVQLLPPKSLQDTVHGRIAKLNEVRDRQQKFDPEAAQIPIPGGVEESLSLKKAGVVVGKHSDIDVFMAEYRRTIKPVPAGAP